MKRAGIWSKLFAALFLAVIFAVVGILAFGCSDHETTWEEDKPDGGITQETYYVTFDKNGEDAETPVPTTMSVIVGEPYGQLAKISRPDYIFAAWWTAPEEGDPITAKTVVTHNADHTLYARWSTDFYMITFDAQGGEGGTTNAAVVLGSPMPPIETPTKEALTFSGYYLQPEGKGRKYYDADGESANRWDFAGNAPLYAKWTNGPEATYKITFDPNGGSEPSMTEKEVTSGETYGVLPLVSRSGYTFTGWFTEAEGGEEITEFSTVSEPSAHTLYAHWEVVLNTGSFNLYTETGTGKGWDYKPNHELTIKNSSEVTISGESSYTFLKFESGAAATVILSTATIDVSTFPSIAGFDTNGGEVTLKLVGASTIRGGKDKEGIFVSPLSTLLVEGSGSLEVSGAVGIGSCNVAGMIVITEGTINAEGLKFGNPGIGSGTGMGGRIFLTGGTVTALGATDAAGIGGGSGNTGGEITITGGTVTAQGGPSGGGAGIGGGKGISGGYGGGYGGMPSIITLTGGNVTATGGILASGIGGGQDGNGGTVSISGKSSGTASAGVTETSGISIPAIGGGAAGGQFIKDGVERPWPTDNPYTWTASKESETE